MGPPHGPACVRIPSGFSCKTFTKNKIQKKTYDSYVNLQHILKVVIFSIFVNLQKCCKFTYESYIVFFYFVFCECFAREPIWYPYTGGSVRRPHLTYGQRNFCTHFFDVATKPLLSEITYDILTRAGPKRLSKNRFFFLERGPGGESLPAAWALEIDGF